MHRKKIIAALAGLALAAGIACNSPTAPATSGPELLDSAGTAYSGNFYPLRNGEISNFTNHDVSNISVRMQGTITGYGNLDTTEITNETSDTVSSTTMSGPVTATFGGTAYSSAWQETAEDGSVLYLQKSSAGVIGIAQVTVDSLGVRDTVVFDTPMLVMPADPVAGFSWSATESQFSDIVSGVGASGSTVSGGATATILGMDTITVGSASVSALKIQTVINMTVTFFDLVPLFGVVS